MEEGPFPPLGAVFLLLTDREVFNDFYHFIIKENEDDSRYRRPITEPLIQYPAQTVLFADSFDQVKNGAWSRSGPFFAFRTSIYQYPSVWRSGS